MTSKKNAFYILCSGGTLFAALYAFKKLIQTGCLQFSVYGERSCGVEPYVVNAIITLIAAIQLAIALKWAFGRRNEKNKPE
jgi:hypothetical protein